MRQHAVCILQKMLKSNYLFNFCLPVVTVLCNNWKYIRHIFPFLDKFPRWSWHPLLCCRLRNVKFQSWTRMVSTKTLQLSTNCGRCQEPGLVTNLLLTRKNSVFLELWTLGCQWPGESLVIWLGSWDFLAMFSGHKFAMMIIYTGNCLVNSQ